MEHTPGPWDVQNKGTLGTRSARHEVVAGINKDGRKNLPKIVKMPDLTARSYANARLISAAPELLEACKLVYRNLKPIYSDEHLCMKLLRSAIKKAEETH